MRKLILAVAAVVLGGAALAQTAASDDPYLWLEDIDGPRAVAQVKEWNAATEALVARGPTFEQYRKRDKNTAAYCAALLGLIRGDLDKVEPDVKALADAFDKHKSDRQLERRLNGSMYGPPSDFFLFFLPPVNSLC